MSRHRFNFNLVVFLAGLAIVCWIAAGYAGSNLLALAVTALIGSCYLAGAFELHRYRQATTTLSQALDGLSEPPPALGAWLERLHPSLRGAVRLRIEGERAALPGPALTPYLVGLLVLLGMLGTLLGMVATLRGTGAALESATNLQAVRASLAAPVNGLGFAFGTSIAGVATSAMLGLLSALCKRERLVAAQTLDGKIATALHVYSHAYRRDETIRLLQRQAEAMPVLAERLQAMMAAVEQRSVDASERQLASQQAFLSHAQTAYAHLASSVAQSLKDSATQSARVAGDAFQPVIEATMAGLAREAASLHDSVSHAVQRQLDSLSSGFGAAAAAAAQVWNDALVEHRRTNEALVQHLRSALDRFAETFDQRSASLLENVSARVETTADAVSATCDDALARQADLNEQLAQRNQRALETAAATFEQHCASLLHTLGQSHADWHAELKSQDQQRLTAWTDALGEMAAKLRSEWEKAGAHTASRQQAICDTLAQTARDISAQTQAHARDTIAEISQLAQAAAQAPKAAAAVIAELRERLSDSLARDTAMLDERGRLLATLETLLDAVNHTCTDQRTAIDALISTSANLLERVGGRFADQVEAETGKLTVAAAQVAAGAVDVASLGDAFGAAVQLFGQSNDKLLAHLERIEAALDKSVARSDEQLAYYVAQAREVVDLSMLAQKQIIEDLQRLANQRASAGAETA
ncbi:DUF802 domain-containing protein [Burkholderia singularis]|uniref:Methyl-accepting chemotaxis protein n=1 Tax=Burkholderia singularis TaxID=1503053 RepID=A0A238H0M1_9BURK|nr:DUF802 domain-containing protein [Burkholderia singularis]SMF98767.1 Methyl-accepting chemotaxis protein [Burkholderia singularis]